MRIKDCFIFANGNVACTDENGEQMPDCQGFILEIAGKLKENCDKNTHFHLNRKDADFSWWFEKHG